MLRLPRHDHHQAELLHHGARGPHQPAGPSLHVESILTQNDIEVNGYNVR